MFTVAVSREYDTCFSVKAGDGLFQLIPLGFQSIVWTFVRHTLSRCLTFPALPEVTRSRGQNGPIAGAIWFIVTLGLSQLNKSTWLPSSSHLLVNMGCTLAIVFQVRSLYTCLPMGGCHIHPGQNNLGP